MIPRPLQTGQIVGEVPGAAPEPRHVVHGLAFSTGTFTVAPRSESGNAICTCTSTSAPRWASRPAVRPPPRLKRPPKRSPRSKPAAPGPAPEKSNPWKPPPVGPWPGRNVWPNVSYCFRFSASESTSYASPICLKRSSAAASPGLRSGWYWRASLR